MTEKKKLYEAPQMEVEKIDVASIICTSGQFQQVSASESLAGTFDLNTETYALTATSGSFLDMNA